MKHHKRQNVDVIKLTHDRAVLLNENGLITQQAIDYCFEDIPFTVRDGNQYWTPKEALELAEAVLSQRAVLEARQRVLDAMITPLADYMFAQIDGKTLKQCAHEGDGDFFWTIQNVVHVDMLKDGHPFKEYYPFWHYSKSKFVVEQLERYLDQALLERFRTYAPVALYMDEEEQEAAEEEPSEGESE